MNEEGIEMPEREREKEGGGKEQDCIHII